MSWSDGNGARGVARIPVVGRERVAAFVVAFRRRFWPGTKRLGRGERPPGAALIDGGRRPLALLTVRRVGRRHPPTAVAVNPDKINAFLRSAGRSADGHRRSTRPVSQTRGCPVLTGGTHTTKEHP